MIYSMTGFSARSVVIKTATDHLQCTITLKTLNSRHLETLCKLPFALTHLETEIIKRCKERIIRGHVYCNIQVSNPASLKTAVVPAMGIIKGYLAATDAIKKQTSIKGDLGLQDLITLPHVFEVPEELVDPATTAQILDIVDTIIDDLRAARAQEGAVLKNDFLARVAIMKKNIAIITSRAESVTTQRREALMNSMQPFLQAATSDTKELQLQQIYNQLDKMDIHEELVRFESHLVNLEQLLLTTTSQENGKKVDFILQELFREISTIMAKCPDSELSNLGIAIKMELEKSREQVQNIV